MNSGQHLRNLIGHGAEDRRDDRADPIGDASGLQSRIDRIAARLERLTRTVPAPPGLGPSATETLQQRLAALGRAAPPVAEPAPVGLAPGPTPSSDAAGKEASPAQRAPAEPPAVAASLDNVAAALRALDSQRREPAPRAPAAEPASGAGRRWSALLAEEPRPASLSAAAPSDDLEGRAARRLAALTGKPSGAPSATATAEPAAAARPEPVAPARSETPRSDRLDAAIAEIAERQRAIDAMAPPPPEPATGRDPEQAAAFADAIEALRADIEALNRATADLGAVGDRQRSSVDDLARRIEAIDASQDVDRRELAALREEIGSLGRALADTARESSVRTMEAGYGHIVERLDELARQEVARTADAGVRLEQLAADIFGRLPPAGAFEKLGAMDAAVARLDDRIGRLDMAVAEAAATPRDLLAAVDRLDAGLTELRAAVQGLKVSRPLQDPAILRLEARIAELADRLDAALARAPRADRIELLVERLESALAAFEAPHPGAVSDTLLQTLAEELSETRRIVAERPATPAAVPAALEALDEKIGLLADRLGHLPAGAEPAALDALEQQVSALAGRLGDVSAVPDAFAEIGQNLARIEALIAAGPAAAPLPVDAVREVAAATARDVAREIVAAEAAAPANDPVITALQDDLRRVQEASRNSGARTTDTLDTMHRSLERIADRLARLEAEARNAGPPASLAAAAPAPVPALIPFEMSPTAAAAPAPPPAAATPEPPRPADEAAALRDRKADFIAAARRAAQAAAAETATLTEKPASRDGRDVKEDRASTIARLTNVFKSRRPLILAAAAVVLTIAVIRVLGPIGLSHEAVAANTPPEQPVARPAVAAVPAADPLPARTVRAAEPARPVVGQTATARGFVVAPEPTVPVVVDVAPSAAADARAGEGRLPSPAELAAPALNLIPAQAPLALTAAPAADAGFATPEVAAGDGIRIALADAVEVPMPEEAVGSLRLRVAAAGGDPGALFEVATRYAEGRGVAQDPAAAVDWYRRAADRGLAVAQFRLGAAYERGEGIATDRSEAATWYERAAAQGHVQAMHNLGVLLSEGVSGAPDYADATRWFAAAAAHGVRDSQYNLGVIHARGIGAAQDLEASYKWFAAAAAQGDADAAARRDDVERALSPDRLALARAALAAFVPEPPGPANTVTVPAGGWDGIDDRLSTAERRELVKRVQDLLAAQGFDPGPADGLEGPKTRDAVRAFQQRAGVPATGVINRALLDVLARSTAA